MVFPMGGSFFRILVGLGQSNDPGQAMFEEMRGYADAASFSDWIKTGRFFLLDQLRGCNGVSRVDLDTLGLVSVFNKVYGDEGTLFRV